MLSSSRKFKNVNRGFLLRFFLNSHSSLLSTQIFQQLICVSKIENENIILYVKNVHFIKLVNIY